MAFGTIEQAIEDIRDGQVRRSSPTTRIARTRAISSARRSSITPEMVNFMIKKAGGLICLALTGERVDALGLDADERDEPRRLPHRRTR